MLDYEPYKKVMWIVCSDVSNLYYFKLMANNIYKWWDIATSDMGLQVLLPRKQPYGGEMILPIRKSEVGTFILRLKNS